MVSLLVQFAGKCLRGLKPVRREEFNRSVEMLRHPKGKTIRSYTNDPVL